MVSAPMLGWCDSSRETHLAVLGRLRAHGGEGGIGLRRVHDSAVCGKRLKVIELDACSREREAKL